MARLRWIALFTAGSASALSAPASQGGHSPNSSWDEAFDDLSFPNSSVKDWYISVKIDGEEGVHRISLPVQWESREYHIG